MKVRRLTCFDPFSCRMGDCPDTCCRDWEIALDPETKAYYLTVSGELGTLLRREMACGDGTVLALDHRDCPFLNETGLCRIQLTCGEEHLTPSCRLYPRFAEEYGALREWCLAISCPEAARLLLQAEDPSEWTEEITAEEITETNHLDAELFYALQSIRKRMFALVLRHDMPIRDRLAALLLLTEKLQRFLHRGKYAAAVRYADGFRAEDAVRKAQRKRSRPDHTYAVLNGCLREMEILTPKWNTLLAEAAEALPADTEARTWENLTIYFLYRYVLKASSEGNLSAYVRAAICGVLSISMTAGQNRTDFCLPAYLYGREVEHSEENFRKLLAIPLKEKEICTLLFSKSTNKPVLH